MSATYTCARCLLRQSHVRQLALGGLDSSRLWPSKLRYPLTALTRRSRIHTGQSAQAASAFTAKEPGTQQIGPDISNGDHQRILHRENLLHSYSNSPSPEIRKRAAFIKNHAYCPHPSHHQTRLITSPDDFESRKIKGVTTHPPAHVRFECPDCKIPVYCCEEHWADDYEMHLEVCDVLQQINTDDHDLRSGRFFREFQYPGPQKVEEAMINLSNWDVFLYTREFEAINEPRHLRQATALLTYPITIGSVLHELSPYDMRSSSRLTAEGLKSLTGKSFQICIINGNQ